MDAKSYGAETVSGGYKLPQLLRSRPLVPVDTLHCGKVLGVGRVDGQCAAGDSVAKLSSERCAEDVRAVYIVA